MTNQEIEIEKPKKVLCKHCNTFYPATKDNFYTANGKLKVSICKSCKRGKTKENSKKNPAKKTDRKEYMKEYYRAYRLKKKLEALNNKNI